MGDFKLKSDALPSLPFAAAIWNTESSLNISNKTLTNNSLLPWSDSLISDVAEKLHLKLLKEMILQLSEKKAVELIFDVFFELKSRNATAAKSNPFCDSGFTATTSTNTNLLTSPKMQQDDNVDNIKIEVDSSEYYSEKEQSTEQCAASNIVSSWIASQNTQTTKGFSTNLKANVESVSISISNNVNEPILRQPVNQQNLTWPSNCSNILQINSETPKSNKLEEENCKPQRNATQKPNKSTKHNDIAFYPNILCIVCHKWVCIRNRFTHIESHLCYRPYKCSICDYNNRKEIFVELHVKNAHGGEAEVIFQQNAALEEEAALLAEQSVEQTANLKKLERFDLLIPDPVCRPSSTLSSNNLDGNCSSPVVLYEDSNTPDKTIKALLNSPSNAAQCSTAQFKRRGKRSYHFDDDLIEFTSILAKK